MFYYHTLGVDHRTKYRAPSGRPVMIVRDGSVIKELAAERLVEREAIHITGRCEADA